MGRYYRAFFLSYPVIAIVVTSIIAAIISMGSLFVTLSEQRSHAEAEMERTVNALAAALDQAVEKKIASLQALGNLLADDPDLERFHRLASAAVGRNPTWSQVTLGDEFGLPLLVTAASYGRGFAGSGRFAELAGEALRTGRPQVSGLVSGPISGQKAVEIFVPVRGMAGRRYVVGAAIPVAVWSTFLKQQNFPAGWVAGIIDRDGTVLAWTRNADQFVGNPAPERVRVAIAARTVGSVQGPSLEGGDLTLVHARAAVSGWTLAFAAPGHLFQDRMRRRLWTNLAIYAFAIGLAATLAAVAARYLSGSWGQSTAEAESSGSGARGDVLMRELQHRVKNDLQTLKSLLLIESSQTTNSETRSVLKALDGKIEALHLVHRRLYDAGEVGMVELGGYLDELCSHSIGLHGGGNEDGISFRARLEPVTVTHDQAVTLGLIVNEFVTNSAKHAFPRGGGHIDLGLRIDPAGQVVLELADDGVGLPRNRTRNSGMMLVEMLAKQIDATVTWRVEGGTRMTLTFPLPAAPAD